MLIPLFKVIRFNLHSYRENSYYIIKMLHSSFLVHVFLMPQLKGLERMKERRYDVGKKSSYN